MILSMAKINCKVLWGWAKFALITIWISPQTAFGLVCLIWCMAFYGGKFINGHYQVAGKTWGFSYGWVVLVGELMRDLENGIKHEQGHTKQCMMLGPAYLFAVGLPSLWNYITRKNRTREAYYKKYPENWADKLGGVVRG